MLGQEAYRSFTRAYYRGSAVAIIVYDVTNRTSFENVESWLNDVMQGGGDGNPNLGLVLVGNKKDLTGEERQVTEEEGQSFADLKGFHLFFETSAKSRENVDKLWISAAEHFYQKFKDGKVDITSDEHGLTLGPKQLGWRRSQKCGC